MESRAFAQRYGQLFFLPQRLSCRQSISVVVYLRQWRRIFLSIIIVLLFRCWFRQDSSVRVAGRVLPDNYGVIVVLRYAQRRRRYPISGMQQFCQFFCKYNTVQLQLQMCMNHFSKCIVPIVFVLFHLRLLNTIDVHSKTFNDHYNVFYRSVHNYIQWRIRYRYNPQTANSLIY